MKPIILIIALLATMGTAKAQKASDCEKDFCNLPLTPRTSEVAAESYAIHRCKNVFHLAPPDENFESCVKQKKQEFMSRNKGVSK